MLGAPLAPQKDLARQQNNNQMDSREHGPTHEQAGRGGLPKPEFLFRGGESLNRCSHKCQLHVASMVTKTQNTGRKWVCLERLDHHVLRESRTHHPSSHHTLGLHCPYAAFQTLASEARSRL